MAEQRRRRVIAVAVLAVVDVVLLVVLLVLLLGQGPGGGPEDPEGTGTATSAPTDGAQPSATAPADAVEVTSFVLPSGNIGCDMAADGVTCRIGEFTYTPPPTDGTCDGTAGPVVELDADGTTVPCVAEAPAVAAPGATTLDYGQTSAVGDFVCTAEESGLRCQALSTGHGFVLARAALSEF